MKKLRRSKGKKKKSTNQEEIGKRLMTFCRRQQDGSVDSVRQESQLYIKKTISMQIEAWTLLDGGSRLYALLHETRVRRELIL
jgi:hypothetical protein